MDMRSLRGKQIDYSASNHDVIRKVPPVEMHENPTINLCEDEDIHFSAEQNIASDELAKESHCILNPYQIRYSSLCVLEASFFPDKTKFILDSHILNTSGWF